MLVRRTHLAIATMLAAGVAAVGVTAIAEATSAQGGRLASAVIRDVEGNIAGRLTIAREGYGKSRVTVSVKGLSEGYHGFHIHGAGVCDPKAVDPATGKVSPFFTAGGHFDLTQSTHGRHSGDLPAVLAGADGTATSSVVTDRFRATQLADADGSAVIVHALADNLANIPERYAPDGPDDATKRTGDAGGRVACGVIK
ncbi:superoxide dismutase family protein [Spongiactinospora sp. TRM90649]|uniref:superoxide dismutase family protein n=1 Tax=Spongiactinospora sp. TRM90649 TaxID=3031114 RepID=UPI0023F6205B|nr:superoxide dismutase family protein [Spongiactinospora sp. TRM90649]MDF5758499.1 superoxide dismutase family protein [Spongiactinospora sp. TRM90649]